MSRTKWSVPIKKRRDSEPDRVAVVSRLPDKTARIEITGAASGINEIISFNEANALWLALGNYLASVSGVGTPAEPFEEPSQ